MDTFCKLLQSRNTSTGPMVVFETENVVAILDHEPFSDGHTLVLPKTHYQDLHDIPDELLQELILVAKQIADRIKDKFNYDGVVIMHNTNKLLEIPHFHMHVYGKNLGKSKASEYGKTELKETFQKLIS